MLCLCTQHICIEINDYERGTKENVNRRSTDNKIAKRKGKRGQIKIYKPLLRKQNIRSYEPH